MAMPDAERHDTRLQSVARGIHALERDKDFGLSVVMRENRNLSKVKFMLGQSITELFTPARYQNPS